MSFLWLSLTESRSTTEAKINVLLWEAKYFPMFPPISMTSFKRCKDYSLLWTHIMYCSDTCLISAQENDPELSLISQNREAQTYKCKSFPAFVPIVFKILRAFINVLHNLYFNFLWLFSSFKTHLKIIPLARAFSYFFFPLFQEVFWRKDRTLFCMAGFVHRIPHSIFSSWDYCISIWMCNHWKWHS